MNRHNLSALLAALPEYELVGTIDPATMVTQITNDSRDVEGGALFIAYRGRNNDLHRFVPVAVEGGAIAAVVEQPQAGLAIPQLVVPNGREAWAWLSAAWEGHPSRELTVIGVTGTDGKTTTVNLIASVLEALDLPHGVIDTLGARIGDERIDTGEHVTTPDAPVVQRVLRQMVEAGMAVALLETTSHALSQHRVTAVEYDIAVVTNITHEHLDEHGSLEAYRAAKRRLFEAVGHSHRKDGALKVTVLNADDSSLAYLSPLPADRQLRYGIEAEEAEISAYDLTFDEEGTHFLAETPLGAIEIHSPLLGRFNVYNILAALSVGVALGGRPEQLQAGISALEVVTGRMEPIDEGQPFLAIVDFAHTPVSLESALQTAREMTEGRVIAVFGSAGLRDRAKRGMMGEIGGRLADMTVITAEDPRTESLDEINAEIAAGAERGGAMRGESYVIVPDRAEAIAWACAFAEPGDLVITCGKGHEPSMCFGTTETPWSEHEALRAALRKVAAQSTIGRFKR